MEVSEVWPSGSRASSKAATSCELRRIDGPIDKFSVTLRQAIQHQFQMIAMPRQKNWSQNSSQEQQLEVVIVLTQTQHEGRTFHR
ncbi:unnamed protein product [Dovyalis caffra]|uniref:Uncharacterized protein n=1 Tax=Dovyalis caffra TaxID=77055 RepID=A0AAV1RM83_9ROSI|nr:unnamed protein product [Dovyalis caffra]